jgi:hypothetical protein
MKPLKKKIFSPVDLCFYVHIIIHYTNSTKLYFQTFTVTRIKKRHGEAKPQYLLFEYCLKAGKKNVPEKKKKTRA